MTSSQSVPAPLVAQAGTAHDVVRQLGGVPALGLAVGLLLPPLAATSTVAAAPLARRS